MQCKCRYDAFWPDLTNFAAILTGGLFATGVASSRVPAEPLRKCRPGYHLDEEGTVAPHAARGHAHEQSLPLVFDMRLPTEPICRRRLPHRIAGTADGFG